MNLSTSKDSEFGRFVTKLASLLKTDETALLENKLAHFPSYDSLGKIEVAMLVEEELGYLISQDELAHCQTAREVFDACAGRQA